MSREAMKLALEALDSDNPDIQLRAAIALRQALEEKQEPVAWLDAEMSQAYTIDELPDASGTGFLPLYTAPPKREWVSLTDEEIDTLSQARSLTDELMDCVEACTTWCGLCVRNPWHRNQP